MLWSDYDLQKVTKIFFFELFKIQKISKIEFKKLSLSNKMIITYHQLKCNIIN